MFSTLTLEEHDGHTTVTMCGVPVNADETERATFAGATASMQGGWSGTLDQLGEELERAQQT